MRVLLHQLLKKLKIWIKRCHYLVASSTTNSDAFVIVTGADSSHYKSLKQFITSVVSHEPKIKIIVYDLGLTFSERCAIVNIFPPIDLRRFNYSMYPGYFNISVNAGEYAWKPIIISDVLNEFKTCVCWMDAGNIVTEPLTRVREVTKMLGMYSPRSSGCISDWTHPNALAFLSVSNNLHEKPNLNGACVAFSYQNPRARQLVARWRKCALTKECIAPSGSNRKNHRQDQAVLSVLAHQCGITEGMPSQRFGFKIHQDID